MLFCIRTSLLHLQEKTGRGKKEGKEGKEGREGITDSLVSIQALKVVILQCGSPCPFPDPQQQSLGNMGNAPGLEGFSEGFWRMMTRTGQC